MHFSLMNVIALSIIVIGILGFSQQKKEGDKAAKVSYIALMIAAALALLVNMDILKLSVEGTFMSILVFTMLGLSLLNWFALKEKHFSPVLVYISVLQVLAQLGIMTGIY